MKKITVSFILMLQLGSVFSQVNLPFEDKFDNGTFHSAWSLHPNLVGVSGAVGVFNGTGTNNSFGVLIGKSSDGASFTTNALDLHLNLSGETDVEMTFWITDHWDETQVDDGLYFSDNGGSSFVKVLDFFPNEWCDVFYGQHPPIDVDGLAAAANLNLNNQFVIRFQQTGQSDFSGTGNNGDGFYLDDVSIYDPNLEYASLPFEDDFNTGILKSSWAWNFADETSIIATGSSITNPMSFAGVLNQTGVEGTPGVLIGRICDGTFTTNALDLHLDLSEETDVEMTFWITDHWDETQVDDGLYFSDNGGNSFVKVLDFFPDEWCNAFYGQHPPIDVDGLAAAANLELSSQFVIRFQQTGQSDFSGTGSNGDGFYLDDVSVYDPNLEYASLPFEDDFNTGILKSSWAWNFANETSTIATGSSITNPMSFAGVLNQTGLDGTPGVLIGRICDGTFTTNALDLHLNLSEETDVEMTFWITDHWDETQVDDGLYFSDNGGNSFVKVLDFFPDEWCNAFYGQHPPIDVDGLAAAANLELSSQFVIRFQQTGQSDFSGTGSNGDGFYLDDVSVYDPNLEYASLPFEDDFEEGVFKPSWAWNFADKTATITSDAAITNPMSFVGVLSGSGHNNSTYAALVGKICDGTFTTNALDLHLNLAGQTDVDLTFWLADHWDETQDDDGIYFSNDAGESFTKVFNFDFTNTPNDVYEFYQLDISSLASSQALSLTDKFVIRFQQRGQSDFSGSGGNGDGFFLDNVNVTGMSTSLSEMQKERTIKIFPNPTSSSVSVYTEELSEKISQIEVLSIDGNIVLKQKFNLNDKVLQFDTSGLPEGIYILSMIFANGETINKKLVKR